MERLRRILILLLCLSVPMAGWASVVDVEFCPGRDHADPAAQAPVHAHSHAHGVTQHSHGAAADHADAITVGGKSADCKGNTCRHSCACGCDMGACTASLAAMFIGGQMGVGFSASHIAIPSPPTRHWSAARDSTPLRPPIS